MKPETRTALVDLNRAFYTRFAGEFARTRRSWPPGFDRILPHLYPAASVLDLGCGNGRLLAFLLDRGWRGVYTGVDDSPGLLQEARAVASGQAGISACFALVDLLEPGWHGALCDPVRAEPAGSASVRHWAAIACLAVIHHIPGIAERQRFLRQAAALLAPGGLLVVSTWQFMSSQRLRQRLLPWEAVGLRDEDVEPGDHVVAWGEGAAGRRYCAFIDRDALDELAAQAGLLPVEVFYSDGHEGNLNLYGVYTR